MIQLGAFDAGVSSGARDAYLKELETLTRVPLAQVAAGSDRIAFASHTPDATQPMTVAEIQQALKDIGFFPGGKVDGICGYRTVSAIRLFQEYVRTIERLPSVPDGRVGPEVQAHLRRWLDTRPAMAWAPAIERWRTGTPGESEYATWLAFLERVKARAMASPTRMLRMVDAFKGRSDTRKPADWDFSPRHIHLVGVRRAQANRKFDDVLVLLIKGLVFKFQGSTDPGSVAEDAPGAPFLVQGQHEYHFGWHRKTYPALRPLGPGVLIVRSKTDFTLDEADLDNGLEANASINVHWGGLGGRRDVDAWSNGCQVINATAYMPPSGEVVSCAAFAAVNQKEILAAPSKTRGAYNVLLDLVTALGSDLPTPTVKYTLLTEADLDLDPAVKQGLAAAAAKASTVLG